MLEAPETGIETDVVAQLKGEPCHRVIGRVRIEDLTSVLNRIARREGANGPQAALTQYLLHQGAVQLAKALGLGERLGERTDVERVLSGLIGHERFPARLGLSVHNMLRRWPTASDWYADLVAYIVRSSRSNESVRALTEAAQENWDHSFGRFIEAIATHQVTVSVDVIGFQLADTVEWLWPDYPPVIDARLHHKRLLATEFAALMDAVLDRYGLRPRRGVTTAQMSWVCHALIVWAGHEEAMGTTGVYADIPAGMSELGWSVIVYFAGAVEDQHGRPLSPKELCARSPRHNGAR